MGIDKNEILTQAILKGVAGVGVGLVFCALAFYLYSQRERIRTCATSRSVRAEDNNERTNSLLPDHGQK